jgi:hypothetical protein
MIARSTKHTEQQEYSVLYHEGDFEIRHYPQALLARVTDPDSSLRRSSNTNFRKLAGYIFGGNREGQKIAMTAPVHMEQTLNGSSMAFVMPRGMDLTSLPKPLDPEISFSQLAPETVAVVRFAGFASDNDIHEKSVELKQWLDKKGITMVSSFRYLGYNPPFQLIDRRNEVVVGIDLKDSKVLR